LQQPLLALETEDDAEFAGGIRSYIQPNALTVAFRRRQQLGPPNVNPTVGVARSDTHAVPERALEPRIGLVAIDNRPVVERDTGNGSGK
jgi:hypothetical protein